MPVVKAAAREAGNIVVLPRQPAGKFADLLSCATATIIALPPGMTGISVPSRMYNIMADGRSIISVVAADSTLIATVRDANEGCHCQANAATLTTLTEDISTADGTRAR